MVASLTPMSVPESPIWAIRAVPTGRGRLAERRRHVGKGGGDANREAGGDADAGDGEDRGMPPVDQPQPDGFGWLRNVVGFHDLRCRYRAERRSAQERSLRPQAVVVRFRPCRKLTHTQRRNSDKVAFDVLAKRLAERHLGHPLPNPTTSLSWSCLSLTFLVVTELRKIVGIQHYEERLLFLLLLLADLDGGWCTSARP